MIGRILLVSVLQLPIVSWAALSLDDHLVCMVVESTYRYVAVGATTPRGQSLQLKSLLPAMSILPLVNPDGGPTKIQVLANLLPMVNNGVVVLVTGDTQREFTELVLATEVAPHRVSLKFYSAQNEEIMGRDGRRKYNDFRLKLDYVLECTVRPD